jgi:DNA-binding LytR/AlgR family response regulator
LESYEFNVVDYLLKPFSFQRFVKAVSKVPIQNIAQSNEENEHTRKEIFIKSGYEYIKITTGDILYIKSDADYTEIFLPNKKYLSSEPLRYWLENLDNNHFMRIHKSYIINISKIEKVASNQVFLMNKIVVPIGRAYKESFAGKFLK